MVCLSGAHAGCRRTNRPSCKTKVLVARTSVKEQNLDNFIRADDGYQSNSPRGLRKTNLQDANPEVVRQQIREQVKAGTAGRAAERGAALGDC